MKGKKSLVVFLAVVLVIGSTFSTGFAQTGIQTIKGWFDKDIKVYNNGVQVSLKETPIIHQKDASGGGTTYVAVRELGELLNKDVTWDQANYSAYIVDKPDENQQNLLRQLIERQEQVKTLEAKVAELENKLKEAEEKKEDKVSDLKDLEKYLNDRNNSYGRVNFDIKLSGTTKDMTVRVSENKKGYYGYSSLTTAEVDKYINNIVYDIQDNFKDAYIEGYIEDLKYDKLVSFYVRTNGKLVIDHDYYGGGTTSGSLRALEDYINKEYKSLFTNWFRLTLSDTKDVIEIKIDVSGDDFYWYQRGSSDFVEDIYADAKSYFKNAWIDIYVYDKDNNYRELDRLNR